MRKAREQLEKTPMGRWKLKRIEKREAKEKEKAEAEAKKSEGEEVDNG